MLPFIAGCSQTRKLSSIRQGEQVAALSLPGDDEEVVELPSESQVDTIPFSSDPQIMRAIKDDQSGEMVATDVIRASKVTARFRHVAERLGKLRLEFDITVPAGVRDPRWQLRFTPSLRMMGDTVQLERVLVTGGRYRKAQLKGYQRYKAFLASILPDSTDYVRIGQFEQFLSRHYPQIYALKTDSTYVSDPGAENLFGVTCAQAVDHYTNHFRQMANLRRKNNSGKMYGKYVKSPIVSDGIRLDTVLLDENGDFVYRYIQDVSSRKGLRKIELSLNAQVYEQDKLLAQGKPAEDLVFYVSSLSSLVEKVDRYKFMIIKRMVYDKTMAIIDFALGKDAIDTTLGSNASELRRIAQCVRDMSVDEAFEPDSIVLTASCSPEGSYRYNEKLSSRRSRSLVAVLEDMDDLHLWKIKPRSVAENWEMFETLAVGDSIVSEREKEELLSLVRSSADRDAVEGRIARLGCYKYLREHVYPRLRTVQIEFYLHRRGMVQDTIHTTELDTVYASGLRALSELDYKSAVEKLRPYGDYNSALALAAAGYNYTALDVLEHMNCSSSRELYLKALVLSRLDRHSQALASFRECVALDPSMFHRANLDPEMSYLLKFINL
ncbi:MAG: hypothetical protein MJY67_02705 [Bacteroidales bacterium]|nr:hypothetical protein [Bacteroidales bacterium]